MRSPVSSWRRLSIVALAMCTSVLWAADPVPGIIQHQGRVAVSGIDFPGPTGLFKFALVNIGGTVTYWSNNGSSIAGSEPTAAVTVTVTAGLYSVLLGDTALGNMTVAIPASVFANDDVHLRLWFDDGTVNGSVRLLPDIRIGTAGYAQHAATIADDGVGTASVADGTLTSADLATNAALTDAQVGPALTITSGAIDGVAIGATSPAAGTFTTATATGALQTGANGADGQLTIYSEQAPTDFAVVLRPNAAMTQATTYTFPVDDGAASQVLTTDGAGALSWTGAGTGTVTSLGAGAGLASSTTDPITTTGSLSIGAGTGIAVAADSVGLSYAANLAANPALAAGESTFATTGVIFEGATGAADTNETLLTVIDPTADRTIALPNNSGTLALLTDIGGTNSGTNTGDVTLAGQNYLSIAGQVITANAVDLSGANATGALAAGRFPALTGDVTTVAGALGTTIALDAVALGADTTGSYVASVATNNGLTGGAAGSETGALTLGLDRTAVAGSDPVIAANLAQFATTGVIFEGSLANGFETTLEATNPTADRTILLPNNDGTLALLTDVVDEVPVSTAASTTLRGDGSGGWIEETDFNVDASGNLGIGIAPSSFEPTIADLRVGNRVVLQGYRSGTNFASLNFGAYEAFDPVDARMEWYLTDSPTFGVVYGAYTGYVNISQIVAQGVSATAVRQVLSIEPAGEFIAGHSSLTNFRVVTDGTGDAEVVLPTGSIGSTEILDATIANADIADTTIDLTTKVTGVVPIANGGTNKALTLSAGGVPYIDADSFEVLAAGNAGDVLISGGAGAPSWAAVTGDISAVGSMTSGAVFADATADDDWLGLGGAAARVEFDDQVVDEVNILSANVGVGTATPDARMHVSGTAAVAATGTISTVGIALTGTGTLFTSEVTVDTIITAAAQSRIVTAIGSNTGLTIDCPFTIDLTNEAFTYRKPIERVVTSDGTLVGLTDGDGRVSVGPGSRAARIGSNSSWFPYSSFTVRMDNGQGMAMIGDPTVHKDVMWVEEAAGGGEDKLWMWSHRNAASNNLFQAYSKEGAVWTAVQTMTMDTHHLGIGDISPTVRLDVADSGAGVPTVARLQNTIAVAANSGAQMAFAANRTTGGMTDVAAIGGLITDVTDGSPDGVLSFSTAQAGGAPAERMRLDETGKLMIGGNADPDVGFPYKLQVTGDIVTTGDDGWNSVGDMSVLNFGLHNHGIWARYGLGVGISTFKGGATATLGIDSVDCILLEEGSGFVGIANLDPAAQLDVVGTTRLGDSATNYVAVSGAGVTTYAGTARPRRSVILTAASAIVPASGASVNQTDVAGEFSYYSIDFADAFDRFCNWQFIVPDSYAAGTTARVTLSWISATGGSNARWAVQFAGRGANDLFADPLPLATEEVFANDATPGEVNTSEFTLDIATDWADGDVAIVKISRLGTAGTDTLADTAKLLQVKVEWLANAESD